MEWRDLVSAKSDKGELDISSVSVPYASTPMSAEDANKILETSPQFGESVPLEAKG